MRLPLAVLHFLSIRFNPRICKRCDCLDNYRKRFVQSFNPRICKRCDYKNKCNNNQSKVSIHASVKDATYDADGENLQICFNPRICKRCDSMMAAQFPNDFVSIHASVKDATAIFQYIPPFMKVSIHASVKDATKADF